MAGLKNRIRELRIAANLDAERLASLAGVSQATVSKLENGKMQLTQRYLELLAGALGAYPADLLPVDHVRPRRVPLVGEVGAGEKYYPDAEAGAWGEIDRVDLPGYEDGMMAVLVKGDSMVPRYCAGDLLFFIKNHARPPASHVGSHCVVQVAHGGPVYVKRMTKGTRPGRFTLESYNLNPIPDAEVEWAAPILLSRPKCP